jgi:hypothetical protein
MRKPEREECSLRRDRCVEDPVPKDHWGRERSKLIARKAKVEYAAGQPSSFEFYTEEGIPLDQINIFRHQNYTAGSPKKCDCPPASQKSHDTSSKIVPRPTRPTKPALRRLSIVPLRIKLLEIAEAILQRGMISESWRTKWYEAWKDRVSRDVFPGSIARLLSELEAKIRDREKAQPGWRERRSAWAGECRATHTLEQLSRLIDELGGNFMV